MELLTVDYVPTGHVKLLEFKEVTGASGVNMDDAEVLVGVGAGVGDEEGFTLCSQLAETLDGTVAASLRAVSAHILQGPLQVGLTGRMVAPRFYIAIGIRGAMYHMMGVQKAETIVAINNDPEADIFKTCDFGVVGDFRLVVPALTHALREAKQTKRSVAASV